MYHFNTLLVLTLPLFQDLHVISTDENRVVAAVQEWNQNETYNLYVSDTSGVYYTLALENVVSSMGYEGNVMVDLYEVSKHDSGLVFDQFTAHPQRPNATSCRVLSGQFTLFI